MGKSNNTNDYDSWYNNLSPNDKQANDSLEKLFNSWTGKEVSEGVEYRWPRTFKEINESNREIQLIEKIPFSDNNVKARYDELKGVIASKMKQVPNFGMKFLISMGICIAGIVVLIIAFQFDKFRQPAFTFNEGDWVVCQSTSLVYDASVGEYGKDKKGFKPLLVGTKLTPVARKGDRWVQVKTPDGDLGYVYYRTLKGASNLVIGKTVPLYSNYGSKSFSDSVRKGEKVTVIGYLRENTEEHENIVRITTSTGKTGYVPSYHLEVPFLRGVPAISPGYIYPTTPGNIEGAKGKTVAELEKKYGPVTSSISIGGVRKAFFSQLVYIQDGKKFSGVFFTLDSKGNITGYTPDDTKKVKLVDRLPLADKFRQAEPFGLISFSFYEGKSIHIGWWQNFRQLNWFTKIIGWIIQFIIGALVIFFLFSIPRLIMQPLMLSAAHIRLLKNGMVLLLGFVVYALATYLFFVWIALLMNEIFMAALFSLIAFSFWWYLYRRNINYNRCPSCHAVNIGLDKGSTYHGRTSTTQWDTFDVYKGKTETSTTITHHYERHDRKTTSYTDHYTDHRECMNCGHRWGVQRTRSAGSKVEKF